MIVNVKSVWCSQDSYLFDLLIFIGFGVLPYFAPMLVLMVLAFAHGKYHIVKLPSLASGTKDGDSKDFAPKTGGLAGALWVVTFLLILVLFLVKIGIMMIVFMWLMMIFRKSTPTS